MEDKILSSAYVFDGKGGGQSVDSRTVYNIPSEQNIIWIHLNYQEENDRKWLAEESKLTPLVLEALTAEDTRPRCFSQGDGLLVTLRGVNLNPKSDPDDMVSIRLWIEANRIITIRFRKVLAINDIIQALSNGNGPTNTGDFLISLADSLAKRMENFLSELDDSVDAFENAILNYENVELRITLSELRRQIIRLKRYLAPQREVMSELQTEKISWITDTHRAQLRENANHITRYVENLDLAKDRASVIQDELESRMGAQMNKTMYILSMVATLFMPLGFLTGLLGINVAGIPGSENPYAFVIVCAMMCGIAIMQMYIFRKLKWI